MKKFLSLMLLPLVSGCSFMGVYEGGFDCPPGQGVGCKSISEVNEMVNAGALPPRDKTKAAEVEPQSDCKSCKVQKSKPQGRAGDIWWAEPLWLESRVQEGLPPC